MITWTPAAIIMIKFLIGPLLPLTIIALVKYIMFR